MHPRQLWPPEFQRLYRERGYWTGETLGGFLRERARSTPGHPAVVSDEERWSYAELDARADAVAGGLLQAGFLPGDRIVLQLPNRPEFAAAMFGMFRAGILPVFALPAHRRAEIDHFVRASGARGYLVADRSGDFDYRPQVTELVAAHPHLVVIVAGAAGSWIPFSRLERAAPVRLPDPDPTSVAFLQLSGGSTGFSKLIPRTHADYLYSVRRSAEICGLGPDSVYLAVLPVAHNYPLSSPGLLGTLYAGGTVAMTPSPSPEVAFPLVEHERVTITGMVPPLALVWLEAAARTPWDLSSLEVLQVGGARFPAEVARRVRPTLRCTLQQVFGMAEGLVNYTRLDDPDEVTVNTQGRPMCPDDEILLVDEEGEPVAPGTPGQLLTRGPYTIRAYHDAPDADAVAFTPDGFYRTGDLVSLRPDGNLVVHGRVTDVVNRGGEKVQVEEVEDHLLTHPGVQDVVVVGIPDAWMGEKSCAVVVAAGRRPTATELRAWIRERGLADFKVPDRVVFVDDFPSTAVGKVSRRELRAAVRRLVEEPHGDG